MSLTIINDVQVGQDTRIDLVSRTHGRKRLPLNQTFSFKPKKTVGMVGEFDNRKAVITYETYDGVTTNFDTVLADQADKDAMLMDVDPNSAVIMDDASQHVEITAMFVNFTGRNTGYKYGAIYAEQLRASTDDAAVDLKNPAKESLAFEGTWGAKFLGKTGQKCSIQYTRFVKSPSFVSPDDVAFVGSNGTFPTAPVPIPQAGGATTLNFISAFLNGKKMNGDSSQGSVDFSITGSTFTPTVAPVSGDVWDVFTLVQA